MAHRRGRVGLGVDSQSRRDLVRKARDAETAHLDAVIKVNGAAYLRLAALADALRADPAFDSSALELKALPGETPALWLDVVHAITMEPDAKTFRLTHHGTTTKSVLLETQEQAAITLQASEVLAHQNVRHLRGAGPKQVLQRSAVHLYVWLTGLVTGAAAMALYFIYLKDMRF